VDILDLGKNLAGMMLSAPGFEVINLVSDVPSQSIVEAVRKHKAKILALSMLLTPMVISLRSRMENISKAGLWDQAKFIVGGACTAPGLA
jgi:5-methyltetrahydrofolate--homocysteine methyltransferase